VRAGLRSVASPVDFDGGGSAVRGPTPARGAHTGEVRRLRSPVEKPSLESTIVAPYGAR
jgi:hypothetical protein